MAVEPTAETRFTLATTAQRGSILAEVARQTKTKLVFLPHHQERLLARVTIDVDNVKVEDLFERVLEGTGLTAAISDGQLTVSGD